jgi:hypothetical protein
MVVLPLSKLPSNYDNELSSPKVNSALEDDSVSFVRIAAAATLVASGALLLSGRRRAGLLAAATGTSLALLDQKDVLGSWWRVPPGYIGEVQYLLTQVQGTVEEVAAQREKLGKVFNK